MGKTAAVLAIAIIVMGCNKLGGGGDAGVDASVAVVATTTPPAAGGICPPGSSGKGTAEEPCKGTGRMLTAKYTGKNGKAAIFSVTNPTKYKISYESVLTYYYDAAGKQLTVTESWNPKYPAKSAGDSGGVFDIDPGQTKEVELGWETAKIPKGAKTIEAEIEKVGWKATPTATDDVYWQNDALAPADRPMGGVK